MKCKKLDRVRVQKVFQEPSRTKQSFKKECDVNQIMKRFKKINAGTEYLDQYTQVVGGQFGDFSSVPDYRTALEQVHYAEGIFDALPAQVRKRFSNDTAEFLDFVANPANKDELVSMGLVAPKPAKYMDTPEEVITPTT